MPYFSFTHIADYYANCINTKQYGQYSQLQIVYLFGYYCALAGEVK